MTLPLPKTVELYLLGIIGLVGVQFHLLPRLTRPEIYFAVTLPENFRNTDKGLRVLRQYQLQVWFHTFVALVLVLSGAQLRLFGLVLAGIFWQVVGCFVAFYWGRRRVLPYAIAPSSVREAELVPRHERLPGGLALQFGPFGLLAGVAAYLWFHWQQIPARFPVHWGLDGLPDRWATRTAMTVFGPLLIGAVICWSLWITSYGILHWARRVHASGPWARREVRFRHLMVSLLLGSEYFLALIMVWTVLLPLRASAQGAPPGFQIYLLSVLAFVVLTVFVLVRTGQGGARLPDLAGVPAQQDPAHSPVGDRTPDRCWKAGLFYVNPADPALFVEARFGLGYTLNFGQVWAWVLLLLMVALPLAVALVLNHSS